MASEIRALPGGELRFVLEDGRPRIDARAILFDSWSVDLGGFRERMMPGSVTLDPDLVALFDHDTSMVLGRVSAGTMEARQDELGVSFTAYPPETTWAADLRVSLERGDIRGCSFRMMVEEDDWYVRDGQVCRDVKKASISELTITSMPAYPETTAEARSHAQALEAHIPAEARAGRVLSSTNEDKIRSAHASLNDVLDTLDSSLANRDAAEKREMTAEDSIYPVTPRQVALEDAIEGVVEVFGKFDQTTGEGGAHYVTADANPFKAEGIRCSNCVFFEGPRGCEIVDGDIDPDAACKFWIVPETLLAGITPAPETSADESGADSTQRDTSVGATETPSPKTGFAPGFGFIQTRKDK